jgi:hypothetical protein
VQGIAEWLFALFVSFLAFLRMYYRLLQELECAEQAGEIWFRLESLAVCICK